MATAQAFDILRTALNSIGVGAAGEPIAPEIANTALALCNDMLDSWSNDHLLIYCAQEVLLELVGGTYIYTIGPGGNVGASFSGYISGTVLTVTALSSGAISVGQILTGSGIASGTAITSFGTGRGGNGTAALGTYNVNLAQTTTATTGSVASLAVTYRGANYASQPAIGFSGGGGAGAAATATLRLSAAFTDGSGAGYAIGDVCTLTGGVFSTPAQIRFVDIAPYYFEVVTPGLYTTVPGARFTASVVTLSGGSGTGAKAYCYWELGDPILTNGGANYTSAPAVAVTGGGAAPAPVQGTITAALANGAVAVTSSATRPLRITSAFVRINNAQAGTLDYPVDILNYEQYQLIGIKTLPGPWPRAVYYQPSEPVGVLNFWPNPSQGEVHLFCDTILNQFSSLTDQVILPQGYKAALQWCLADWMIPFFPATGNAMETRAKVPEFARQGRQFLKRTNMQPPPLMGVDSSIVARGGRDAGWILHGGFIR